MPAPRRRPRPLHRLRRLHLKPHPRSRRDKIKETNMNECTPKQTALAAIEGLTLYDCLNFFDESKDQRANDIVELDYSDDFEIDTYHTSEGEDNGAYVLGWRWFSFAGSKLSKLCSNCDSKDGEIKCVEMSDGTTESLCKTCLEMICPGCEAAPDKPT